MLNGGRDVVPPLNIRPLRGQETISRYRKNNLIDKVLMTHYTSIAAKSYLPGAIAEGSPGSKQNLSRIIGEPDDSSAQTRNDARISLRDESYQN